jgi:hypothetical protein
MEVLAKIVKGIVGFVKVPKYTVNLQEEIVLVSVFQVYLSIYLFVYRAACKLSSALVKSLNYEL